MVLLIQGGQYHLVWCGVRRYALFDMWIQS